MDWFLLRGMDMSSIAKMKECEIVKLGNVFWCNAHQKFSDDGESQK